MGTGEEGGGADGDRKRGEGEGIVIWGGGGGRMVCQQNGCQAVQVIIINILSIHISDITACSSSRPSAFLHQGL
jgi:hypothetical protein